MEKIQLSSAHSGMRMTLAVLFLALGVAAFAYGIMQLVREESGWQQISAQSSGDISCADEFVFLYDVGAGGKSAKEEKRAVTSLYSDAAVTAYRLFSSDELFDGVVNVRYLNDHPNETLTVEPALYDAFAQIQAAGDRTLYLGPVSSYYDNLFYCEDSVLTAEFDPRQSEQTRQFCADCCAFTNDPGAVDVELLDENRVRLNVSEAYLAFSREEEIDTFIDFYWMKNAFIADYLAGRLTAEGYEAGALSSYDGFTRNLSAPELGEFGFNVYDGPGEQPIMAATMVYSGSMSIVYLHSYSMNDMDARHYFTLSGGEIRSAYLDPADGLCKSATDDLIVYSRTGGCAETLLRARPVFVADAFRPEMLADLTEEGIYAIYCQDRDVIYNEPEATFSSVYETEELRYSTVLQN